MASPFARSLRAFPSPDTPPPPCPRQRFGRCLITSFATDSSAGEPLNSFIDLPSAISLRFGKPCLRPDLKLSLYCTVSLPTSDDDVHQLGTLISPPGIDITHCTTPPFTSQNTQPFFREFPGISPFLTSTIFSLAAPCNPESLVNCMGALSPCRFSTLRSLFLASSWNASLCLFCPAPRLELVGRVFVLLISFFFPAFCVPV